LTCVVAFLTPHLYVVLECKTAANAVWFGLLSVSPTKAYYECCHTTHGYSYKQNEMKKLQEHYIFYTHSP